MNAALPSPLVIWRIIDGKPGHQAQSQGLITALSRKQRCLSFDIPLQHPVRNLRAFTGDSWPTGGKLPRPDFIIGAGHRTHLSMLAAKRVYGGRTIVLMKPSLPAQLFDLCLIPEHDRYRGNGTILETRGVLNPMQPQGAHLRNKTLIMIGGPSKHFGWQSDALIAQIIRLCRDNPEQHFCLTTSRRTPTAFLPALESRALHNLSIVPFASTDKDWVARHLADSYRAWITEDSTSMVYEALTARTAVGILTMPKKRNNRVARGIERLIQSQLVARFDASTHYKTLMHPVTGFTEADRCAEWILHSWQQPAPVLTADLAWQNG
jgi:hypothetical protein